eukprot:3785944-Pyramimonas_sp.AAC.1
MLHETATPSSPSGRTRPGYPRYATFNLHNVRCATVGILVIDLQPANACIRQHVPMYHCTAVPRSSTVTR